MKGFLSTMTAIESIYEIEAAISDLQPYLQSRDRIVFKRARIRYAQLVDRFFRENVKDVKPEHRNGCLDDVGYFIEVIAEVKEAYNDQI